MLRPPYVRFVGLSSSKKNLWATRFRKVFIALILLDDRLKYLFEALD
jgi:hypothetical protein